MKVDSLYPFILSMILIGMLLGVGILVFDNFGSATFKTQTVTNESFTVPAQGANVTLANGNMTSLSVINTTQDVWSGTNYTAFLVDGRIQNDNNGDSCIAGQTCFATYTYKEYNTQSKATMADMTSATGAIGTTWIALIVTVVILSIVLVLVITSFRQR